MSSAAAASDAMNGLSFAGVILGAIIAFAAGVVSELLKGRVETKSRAETARTTKNSFQREQLVQLRGAMENLRFSAQEYAGSTVPTPTQATDLTRSRSRFDALLWSVESQATRLASQEWRDSIMALANQSIGASVEEGRWKAAHKLLGEALRSTF